jgi:hypothetical protein
MLTAGLVQMFHSTLMSPSSHISKISGAATGLRPSSSGHTFHRFARSFMCAGFSQLRYAGYDPSAPVSRVFIELG